MDIKFPCCGMQSTFQRRQFNFRRRVALDSKSSTRKGVEVKPQDWNEKVYRPDIFGKWDIVYKKPGYDPSDLR
jgi:hypothetical protein